MPEGESFVKCGSKKEGEGEGEGEEEGEEEGEGQGGKEFSTTPNFVSKSTRLYDAVSSP